MTRTFDGASASGAKMVAADFIWLAALGTAARGPVTIDDIRSAIDDIAGHLWSPAGDVVANCVDEMVRGGTLGPVAGMRDVPPAFATTATGRQMLSLPLAKPIGQPTCPLGRVGLALKLAFVDLVPAAERRHAIRRVVATFAEGPPLSSLPDNPTKIMSVWG